MTRKYSFALLAILLIPLSGCFGGTIGDVTAQDGIDENGATIVYNFYNNSTTSHPAPVYKSMSFDVEFSQFNLTTTYRNSEYNILGDFSTVGGNLYSVVYSESACKRVGGWWEEPSSSCDVLIRSTCDGVVYPPINAFISSVTTSETNSFMLVGTAESDCVHEILVRPGGTVVRMYYEIGFKQIHITPI